ncbi:leucyl/phenylalanyl-tRNA--protein transferase [Desulfobotulus sp. H1]|uniref:Leucyl/phenylalanyl-tRNA--protein transferase n=1 Tax=Desulfobotulus pelophilus TaxID=2823377 RepID=A0ABT3NCL2_9BACT|nr:leucyl/phenylalanyl-tRNA--protein transferase [Desulfobotulus pelophilus]MCW7755204.1 leucyl/phenylalanyl-tRNA--protein transferase [Desulfobotulus pelophilus]
MPVFQLGSSTTFPPAVFADQTGLLAIGGDLSIERLLSAYAEGIFPWYSEGDPILWWSPDPRLVLIPASLHISKSLRKRIRKQDFYVTMDESFTGVLEACAETRREKGEETWIMPEMMEAYQGLHDAGYAHSVEVRGDEGELRGGLYGVSLGRIFFGESMFTKTPDASKIALAALAGQLHIWNFDLIDCQMETRHLISMGAARMGRRHFLSVLKKSLQHGTCKGPWIMDALPMAPFFSKDLYG